MILKATVDGILAEKAQAEVDLGFKGSEIVKRALVAYYKIESDV